MKAPVPGQLPAAGKRSSFSAPLLQCRSQEAAVARREYFLELSEISHPHPSRLAAFPLAPLGGSKPQQHFLLEKQSPSQSTAAGCDACCHCHSPAMQCWGRPPKPFLFSGLFAGLLPSPRVLPSLQSWYFWSFSVSFFQSLLPILTSL